MYTDREQLLNLLSSNIEGGAKKKKLNKGLLEYQKFVRMFKNKGVKREVLTKLYRRRDTPSGKKAIKMLKSKLRKKGYKIRGGMMDDYSDSDSDCVMDCDKEDFGMGILGGKKKKKRVKKKSHNQLTPLIIKKFINLGKSARMQIDDIFNYRDKLEGGSIQDVFNEFKKNDYEEMLKSQGKDIPLKKKSNEELLFEFQSEFVEDPEKYLKEGSESNLLDYNLGFKIFKDYNNSVANYNISQKDKKKPKSKKQTLNLDTLYRLMPGQKPDKRLRTQKSKESRSSS